CWGEPVTVYGASLAAWTSGTSPSSLGPSPGVAGPPFSRNGKDAKPFRKLSPRPPRPVQVKGVRAAGVVARQVVARARGGGVVEGEAAALGELVTVRKLVTVYGAPLRVWTSGTSPSPAGRCPEGAAGHPSPATACEPSCCVNCQRG